MQKRIRAVFMRGGTSKAVFFHENHLPKDPEVRDRVILAAYGSPDPNRRQIDGMGGAVSSTSKVAIISPAEDPDYDVNYNFGQVSIGCPLIDYLGNCGNILAAVGPFAVDEGLVKAREPLTRVRIFQVNTAKRIEADVPVRGGRFDESGDFAIDGVPGTSAKIELHYLDPGGAVTGRLLPTGNAVDTVDLPGRAGIDISIVDAANPLVFVRARDLGLRGIEIEEIGADAGILKLLEALRSRAAVMAGMASSPEEATQKVQAVPKIAVVSRPQGYKAITGASVQKNDVDLVARIISMGALHKAYTGTGAICTAGAAKIKGTIANEMFDGDSHAQAVRIGHPGGVSEIGVRVERDGDIHTFVEAVVGRTARRLMEGYVFIPEKFFS